MAKVHVSNFYKEQIKQFLSMQETARKMEEAYKNKEVSEETYANFVQLTEALRTNVDRISYIVFLMNQPRFSLKRFLKNHESKLDYFAKHNADEAGVFAENNTVLQDMQQYIDLMKEIEDARVSG